MAGRGEHKRGLGLFGSRPSAEPVALAPVRPAAVADEGQEAVSLNLRALAGAAAMQAMRFAAPAELDLAPLTSRPARYDDVLSGWFGYWAQSLHCVPRPHRKLWEFIATLQAFYEAGVITSGARFLGFGTAGEPIPSLLSALGMNVVATDLAGIADRERMLNPQLVDPEVFDSLVEVSNLDMRRLDDPTLRGFDGCWSCSLLNEMTSVDEALETAIGAMDVLRPGGVAVHTFDFAFAEDMPASARGALVFPRRFFERLAEGLEGRGHSPAPLSFDLGGHPLDGYVDHPPFEVEGSEAWQSLWSEGLGAPHLKIDAGGSMRTALVFIARARG